MINYVYFQQNNLWRQLHSFHFHGRLRGKTLDNRRIGCSIVFFVFRELTILFGETLVSSRFCSGLRTVCSCCTGLRTISSRFFRRTQRMFMAQWVRCSSEFLFSSVFVGRFSYLTNNFHTTAGSCPSFSPGSQEIRGKINFPNMFASVYSA